jgi:hypothetical protein
VQAVEDEVKRELELAVIIARPEGAPMGDRERHFRRIRKGGRELGGETGRGLRIGTRGIVEDTLGEPEHLAAEDVQGVVCLCDREAAFTEDAEHRVDIR